MSQNITIKEGDIAQGFGHINKLRTNNGSGYDRWVPEDEVDTESLHADKNGLYYTKAYAPTKKEKKKGKKGDCYGYDEVTVSITNKTTGLNGDGNPISVGVDDEGNLEETELPVRIEIIQPPTQLNYVDGQDINIDGIQVKAYLADDSEYETGTEDNTIPIEELDFEPKTAILKNEDFIVPSQEVISHYNGAFSSSGELHSARKVVAIRKNASGVVTAGGVLTADNPDVVFYVKYQSSNFYYIAVAESAFTITYNKYDDTQQTISVSTPSTSSWSGKTYYYYRADLFFDTAQTTHEISPSVSSMFQLLSLLNASSVGDLTFYKSKIETGNEITVKWTPPDGIDELTDTYEIIIGQGPIPPNN